MAAPLPFRLRAATAADFDFMQATGHEGLRPHVEPLAGWDQAEHERAFRDAFDPAHQQIVELAGEPAGYLHLLPQADHTLIAGLYLRADWRGRGLGGAIVADLCRQADLTCTTLRLRVHHSNPAARLYARHGFTVEHTTDLQQHMFRLPHPARGTAMSRITRNHHVLAVPDAERSARFFVDGLGFSLLPVEDPGWRFVVRDGVMIMLGSCPDDIDPRELGSHQYFAYLVVDDVDGCYREFTAAGVEVIGEPVDRPWRMREFGVRTVDGHRMMVGQDLDV